MANNNNDFTQKIAEILVKNKAVSSKEAADLQAAFSESDHNIFTDFLYEEGLVDKEQILIALGQYYQVPYFDTDGYFFDHLLLRDFPKDFLLRNNIIPLEIDQNVLVFVAADPSNPDLLSEIGKYAPYDIQFYVSVALDIQEAIKEFYDKSLTDPDDMLDRNDEVLEESEINEIREISDQEDQ